MNVEERFQAFFARIWGVEAATRSAALPPFWHGQGHQSPAMAHDVEQHDMTAIAPTFGAPPPPVAYVAPLMPVSPPLPAPLTPDNTAIPQGAGYWRDAPGSSPAAAAIPPQFIGAPGLIRTDVNIAPSNAPPYAPPGGVGELGPPRIPPGPTAVGTQNPWAGELGPPRIPSSTSNTGLMTRNPFGPPAPGPSGQ
jgi:hypothetical protein